MVGLSYSPRSVAKHSTQAECIISEFIDQECEMNVCLLPSGFSMAPYEGTAVRVLYLICMDEIQLISDGSSCFQIRSRCWYAAALSLLMLLSMGHLLVCSDVDIGFNFRRRCLIQ